MNARAALAASCGRVLAAAAALPPIPVAGLVRSIHHLSSTGGTIISRCLAAMPNTVLLNEIDPLHAEDLRPLVATFLPRDLIAAIRRADPTCDEALLTELFVGPVATMERHLRRQGRRLLIRDHAHGAFLTRAAPGSRRYMLEMLRAHFPHRGLVTVRDPIDSYLGLLERRWIAFAPATFDEYCRRYQVFLDAHAGLPVVRYEDFVAAPGPTLRAICAVLAIPYADGYDELQGAITLSGDSGRRGVRIEPRPRRELPAEVSEAIDAARAYPALARRLGYPLPGAVTAVQPTAGRSPL